MLSQASLVSTRSACRASSSTSATVNIVVQCAALTTMSPEDLQLSLLTASWWSLMTTHSDCLATRPHHVEQSLSVIASHQECRRQLNQFIISPSLCLLITQQSRSAWVGCSAPSVCLYVCLQHNSKNEWSQSIQTLYRGWPWKKKVTLGYPRNNMVWGVERSRSQGQWVHFLH